MKISTKFAYIRTKIVIIFLVLLFIGSSIQYHFYKNEKSLMRGHAQEIIDIESRFVHKYLERIDNVLESYKIEATLWPHFDADKYNKMAKGIIRNFPDIQAVNFLNHNYVISNIYPYKANKAALGKNLRFHLDPKVKEIFNKGLSKTKTTFLPPVEIYQGGAAIIFYLPIQFRDKSNGWLNIVIKTQSIFSIFFQENNIHQLGHGLFDLESNRVYYQSGKLELKTGQEDYVYNEINFIGRRLSFIINYSVPISKLRRHYIVQWSLLVIILLILSYLLFHYFLTQRRNFYKCINTRDESNLLKILIHDISSPLIVIRMNIIKILNKEKPDHKLLEGTLSNVNSIVDIVKTIRSMQEFDNHDHLERVSPTEIVHELISENQSLLDEKDLRIQLNLTKKDLILHVNKSILKNHILNNLLINAIKFSHHDSEITINYNGRDFTFLNTSAPISEEVLENLNSFHIAASTKGIGDIPGLGLGLFIAKIFCNRYGFAFRLKQNRTNHIVQTSICFQRNS